MGLVWGVRLASLLSVLACSCGQADRSAAMSVAGGGSGNGSAEGGSTASTGASTSTGSTQSTDGGDGQTAGNSTGGTSSSGGASNGGAEALQSGGPRLRILTRPEYINSITHLLGTIHAMLELPFDADEVGGFAAVGAGLGTINSNSVALYEVAGRAAAAEVFADTARWQKLVGCQPETDLSDPCVVTFIKSLGKRAFRRDLTDDEVESWLKVGQDAARLSNSAEQGLSTLTSGLLQSPYFLYRVETNQLDATAKRLKYDGRSMATRLAYLLTAAPPSDELLAVAESGQLDSADGVSGAAAPLLDDPRALDRMAVFFNEFAQASLVRYTPTGPRLFPSFTAAVKESMLESAQLFVRDVVVATGADMRAFYDSDQFFVDANLAPIYGVSAPASGFMRVTLGPESGRAGILGQAAVLAGHSRPNATGPSHRGEFIVRRLLCEEARLPPAGVNPVLPEDDSLTTRQKLERLQREDACRSCHEVIDPLGFGLEHLDAIGQYRATENGKPIDATGSLDGVDYDGGAELGAVLAKNQRALTCLINNFYRHANGVEDTTADSAQIEALSQTLAAKGYVWRDFLAEFLVSEAFRSAPAKAAKGSP